MKRSTSEFLSWTAADLFERWGAVPLDRIRVKPFPFVATEQDVIEAQVHEDRLFELVDGVLLAKTHDLHDAWLTTNLVCKLGQFVAERDFGIVLGSDGPYLFRPGHVRIPDISFVSWNRLPKPLDPAEYFLRVAPDFVIEFVNDRNTVEEMATKRRDYFAAGVRLLWYVYRLRQSVEVFTSDDRVRLFETGQTLGGFEVLPGFSVEVAALFEMPQRPQD